MQHKLSVTGSLPKGCIPVLRGIEVEEGSDGITFTASSAEEMKKLKRMLSFSLTDVITGEYETKKLSDIIFAANPCLMPEERQKVLQMAGRSMQKLPPGIRSHHIEDKLYAFLKGSEKLSLEGFVNFRLKEYGERLKRAAMEATESYMAEKEYEEFIALLRCFVAMQPSRYRLLHILCEEGGTYRFFNEGGKDVTERLRAEVFRHDAGILSEDDLLISLLISFAPGEVVLHKMENLQNPGVAETILKVFGKRVKPCEKCPICKSAE